MPDAQKCSMYGVFTYMWLQFIINVGKYCIHGSYGHYFPSWFLRQFFVAGGANNQCRFEPLLDSSCRLLQVPSLGFQNTFGLEVCLDPPKTYLRLRHQPSGRMTGRLALVCWVINNHYRHPRSLVFKSVPYMIFLVTQLSNRGFFRDDDFSPPRSRSFLPFGKLDGFPPPRWRSPFWVPQNPTSRCPPRL